MRNRKVHQILTSAFQRKEKQGHGYSKRALARDLGVSPAFITNLLQGKKAPPKDRIPAIIKILELDTIEQRELSRALLLSKTESPALQALLKKELDGIGLNRKTMIDVKQNDLLAEWWFIPVMESLSLNPRGKPEETQRRLGITKGQWNRAISVLLKEGVIYQTEDGYKKKEDHVYLSSARSKASIRAFHKMMLEKALLELEKTQESDFQRRLITGYTFALSDERLEELKAMIMQFLDRAARKATEGKCTDLYQLNVQFFPLTKS